jgi:DNA polymerase III, delta subunit
VSAAAILERLAASPELFPGTLLLTGPSEAALDRESRRLAARLLCPGDDPEGECRSCRRVEEAIHPDLMTLLPEGVGQIRVERVREALGFAAGRPYEGARRVVRIPAAERLGVEAGNALLKSLEEPGARVRWILTTTRPEALLSTIRSRAAIANLPAPGRAEREAAWRDRGFSEEDAQDLVLAAGAAGERRVVGRAEGTEGRPTRKSGEDEKDPKARLEEFRASRQLVVAALEEGLAAQRLPALILCAEAFATEPEDGRLLAELLADAALATAAVPAEALRHRAVAGRLSALARKFPPGALREAAVAAADAPADRRRGNRRLHFEKVLIGLYRAVRKDGGRSG